MSNQDNKPKVVTRIPPQNTDAEASLLGSILIDEEVLTQVADQIHVGDFYDDRHNIIFEAMLSLYEKHRPIDHLTLSNLLLEQQELDTVGGASYLTELTNIVPTAAHASQYASIIEAKAVRRRLIKASEDITKLSFDETTDDNISEILEKAEARLFKISQKAVSQDLVSLEEILSDSFDRLDELHKDKSKLRGIPTGYRDLDNILAGLQRSDLVILAARPAMGKTTLALNIAHNIATMNNDAAVLVFSLEMSRSQLADRMLSDEAGIDAWNLRTGNLADADFEKLGSAMGVLSEAQIYIDDTPGINILEMRTKARRHQQKQPLSLIIVDYLQLMSGSSGGGGENNRVQEISAISRGLKLIARELDVPVLALSQLSRSVENRTPQIPQLSDLRESGSIEQDADVVAFVYREDYYNTESERKNITDIFIKKHRNGPTGRVELYFHPERLRFNTIENHR